MQSQFGGKWFSIYVFPFRVCVWDPFVLSYSVTHHTLRPEDDVILSWSGFLFICGYACRAKLLCIFFRLLIRCCRYPFASGWFNCTHTKKPLLCSTIYFSNWFCMIWNDKFWWNQLNNEQVSLIQKLKQVHSQSTGRMQKMWFCVLLVSLFAKDDLSIWHVNAELL